MLVHRKVILSSKLTATLLYTWVERGTVRVKYLAQGHNTISLLEPGPLDPELSALTMTPLHLLTVFVCLVFVLYFIYILCLVFLFSV